MEKSTATSWLIHHIELLLRNLAISLHATLLLFVLYFSLYEDERASILFYMSVILSVLAMKYTSWGMTSISASLIYLINILSKTLILSGVFLFTFTQFWSTAFYSICLGIISQKMKYENEIELKEISIDPYINDQVLGDSKNDTLQEFKPLILRKTSNQLNEVTQDATQVEENKRQDLCTDECSSLISRDKEVDLLFRNISEALNNIKELAFQNERQNSPKNVNKTPVDFCEIVDDHDERTASLLQNLDKKFLEQSNQSVLLIKKQKNSLENLDDSTMKDGESLHESKSGSNYVDVEDIRQEMLNLHEFAQTEFYKSELDGANITLETKRGEGTNGESPESNIVLNDEALKETKFPENGVNQLDTTYNRIESINERQNKVKESLFHEQVNINSHVHHNHFESAVEKSNFSNLFENRISACQQNQSEIEDKFILEHLIPSKDNTSLLLFDNECIDLDDTIRLQNEGDSSKTKFSELEMVLNDETALTKENASDANSYPKTMCASKNYTSEKNVDIQPEQETCALQMKCISGQHYIDGNLKLISKKNIFRVFPEEKNCFEAKTLCNSCMTLGFEGDSSKSNELANNVEETNESATKTSGCLSTTYFPRVSDVEDVVNRIDMGFIYALGFDVPRVIYEF